MSVTTRKAPPNGDRSWRKTLEARPVHNHAADVFRGDDGVFKITVKTVKPWFLVPPFSWIVRPRFSRTYRLDRLGAQVWGLCDGERTVEQIVDGFAALYRLTFHEARAAVTGYLKELVRRGALVIAM